MSANIKSENNFKIDNKYKLFFFTDIFILILFSTEKCENIMYDPVPLNLIIVMKAKKSLLKISDSHAVK